MYAAITQNLTDEVRGTVGDQVLLGERGDRGDEHGELDHPHALEVTGGGRGDRQDVQTGGPGEFQTLLGTDRVAELAGHRQAAVDDRELPRGEHQGTRHGVGLVGRGRGRHRREFEAECGKTLGRAHASPSPASGRLK